MVAKFVNIDRATPLLLPLDLREWVNPEHMVHFVMDAVEALNSSDAGAVGADIGYDSEKTVTSMEDEGQAQSLRGHDAR